MKNTPNSHNNPSSSYAFKLILVLTLALLAFPGHAAKVASIQDQPEAITAADKVVRSAKQLIVGADGTRLKFAGETAELKKLSVGEALNQESLSNIASLTRIVNRIDDTALPKEMEEALKILTDIKLKLEKAKTDLAAITPQTAETAAAIQRVNSALAGVDEAKAELTKANGELAAALVRVYAYVTELAVRANNDLASLKKTSVSAEDFLILLPRDLSKLVSVLQSIDELKARWNTLSDALSNVFGEHQANATKTNAAITTLDESISTIVVSLDTRLKSLADYAGRKSGNIVTLIERYKQNPQAVEEDVQRSLKEASLITEGLDRISNAWDILAVRLANVEVAGVDAAKIEATRKARDEMFEAARDLSKSRLTLEASQGGPFEDFVTEKVRLYYFTDVPRLIKTLNDAAFIKGGDPAAQARSAEELQKLREIEIDLREAEAEAAKFKARQLALQRQLDDARADLGAASILSRVATSRLDELKRRPEGDVPKERMARAEEEKKQRDDETNKAQQRFDELNDEQSGLPAKIREARERRDEAQTEMERLAGRLSVSAQTESAAFARARDNAPFWFASPVASHPDPLKRVELSSSTGGDNTITIRGKRADVDKVKEYIAVLDEPAPQARMTLWKLELSSDASNEGTKRFNEALRIVEDELADTRGKIAGAVSLLLDTVNEEANYQAEGHRKTTQNGQEIRLSASDARYRMYAPEVMNEIGVAARTTEGVLSARALGLKDPGKATTLNEALMILLMSQRERRQNVFHRLERRMPDLLAVMTTLDKKKQRQPEKFVSVGNRWFSRLHTTMGDDLDNGRRMSCKPNVGDGSCLPGFPGEPCPAGYHSEMCRQPGSDIELTRSQGELVYALKFRAVRRIIQHADELDVWLKEYREVYGNYVAARGKANEGQARTALEDKENEFPLFRIISSDCGVETREFWAKEAGKEKYKTISFDKTQNKRDEVLIKFVRNDDTFLPCRLGFSSARNAAADGILKILHPQTAF